MQVAEEPERCVSVPANGDVAQDFGPTFDESGPVGMSSQRCI